MYRDAHGRRIMIWMCQILVALNRRFRIEKRAIQNRAIARSLEALIWCHSDGNSESIFNNPTILRFDWFLLLLAAEALVIPGPQFWELCDSRFCAATCRIHYMDQDPMLSTCAKSNSAKWSLRAHRLNKDWKIQDLPPGLNSASEIEIFKRATRSRLTSSSEIAKFSREFENFKRDWYFSRLGPLGIILTVHDLGIWGPGFQIPSWALSDPTTLPTWLDIWPKVGLCFPSPFFPRKRWESARISENLRLGLV